MEINQALHQVVTTYVPTHALVVTWKITETAVCEVSYFYVFDVQVGEPTS